MRTSAKRALLATGFLGLTSLSGCYGSYWAYCVDGDYYEQNRVYGIDDIRAVRAEIVNGLERFVPVRADETVRASEMRLQVTLETYYDYIYNNDQSPAPSARKSITDWFISSAHASGCGYTRYDDLLERVTDATVLATPGYTTNTAQSENLTDTTQIIYEDWTDQIIEPLRDYTDRREYAVEQFHFRVDSTPASAASYRFTVRLAFDDGYVYERTSAPIAIEP